MASSEGYDELGPPMRMQDALRSHVSELVKSKEINRTLLEKFKLATALHEEKVSRNATENGQLISKCTELEKTVESLMEINERYRTSLLKQNQAKEVFQAKVREIGVTIDLLQQRENKTNEINTELKRERDILQREMKALKERFEFETKREAEALKRRITEEHAAAKVKNDNDAKSLAIAQKAYQDEVQTLKRSNELGEREMAQRLKDNERDMAQRLKEDYVAKVEFYRLKEMYDLLLDDKKILEESFQILEVNRNEAEARAIKADAELSELKGKVYSSEKEMLQSKLNEERAMRDLGDSQEEVTRALKVQSVNEERLLTLEREKSMLLTQVASLKFDNSRTQSLLAETRKSIVGEVNPEGPTPAKASSASAGRALNTHDLR